MSAQLSDYEWGLKIAALLHDPVTKPLLRLIKNVRHEEDAEYIAKDLGVANIKVGDARIGQLIKLHHEDKKDEPFKAITVADRNSSAADRLVGIGKVDNILPIHPLSGEELSQLRMFTIDISEVKNKAIGYLTGLGIQRHMSDPKLLYLALWRHLPDALVKGMKVVSDGFSIDFINANLPADTRFPTHTIWDHLRTTSALVMCVKDGELRTRFLRFELGGIQEFLSNARTTADYWAGSWIASALMFSIIRRISDSAGPDAIIYPDVHGLPLMDLWLSEKVGMSAPQGEDVLMPVIPEAVLVITPQDMAEPLKKECKDGLEEAWRKLCSEAREGIKKLVKDIKDWGEFDKAWDRQIEALPFDFRVTEIEWPGNEKEGDKWLRRIKDLEAKGIDVLTNDVKGFLKSAWKIAKQGEAMPGTLYSGLCEELQAKVHASGLVRHFENPVEPGEVGGEGLRKRCNVCGARNPVWDPEDSAFWKDLETKFHIVDFNERLCSVCLVKRILGWGKDGDVMREFLKHLCRKGMDVKREFPSTSDVATANFKEGVLALWGDIKDREIDGKKFSEYLSEFLNSYEEFAKKIGDEIRFVIKIPKLRRMFKEIPREGVEPNEEARLLEKFLGITGEYLFEETYDREVKRIEDRLSRMKGENRAEIEQLKEKIEKIKAKGGELEKVKKALREFLEKYKETVKAQDVKKKIGERGWRIISKPNDTLAIIAMDGDSMGKWVSGGNNPTVKDSIHEDIYEKAKEKFGERFLRTRRGQSPANHAFISRTLSTYSLNVVKKVIEEEYCGRLIYAGGDDVRALLPPEDAFEVAMRLREEYSREWGAVEKRGVDKPVAVLGMGHRATSSLSLVCIHYMYHLSAAIDMSWEMLKEAKKYSRGWEKDAVYVTLHSRGGEVARASPVHLLYPDPKEHPVFRNEKHWQGVSALKSSNRLGWLSTGMGSGKGHRSPLIDALELSQLIKRKEERYELSRRVLYELMDEVDLLEGSPAEAVKAELRRLIKRHLKVKGEGANAGRREFVDRLADALAYWHGEGCLKEVLMLAKIADSLLGDVEYGVRENEANEDCFMPNGCSDV